MRQESSGATPATHSGNRSGPSPCSAAARPLARTSSKTHEAGGVIMGKPLGIVVHDVLQRARRLAHVEHLVHLLLVLGHHEPGLGQSKNVPHFVGGRVLVQAERHAAQPLDGQFRPQPFRSVVADEHDHIAPAQPQRPQPGGEFGGDACVVLPAHGLPHTPFLFAQRGAAAVAGAVFQQQAGQRFIIIYCHYLFYLQMHTHAPPQDLPETPGKRATRAVGSAPRQVARTRLPAGIEAVVLAPDRR